MSEQQPNEIHLENVTFEDPLLNGKIKVNNCYAVNMTEQEINDRLREIFSNPMLRKKMNEMIIQDRQERN